MCTGAEIAVIAAIGSNVLGAINTAKVAKKQDKIAADTIRKQRDLERQAAQRVQKVLGVFEQSGPEEYKQDLASKYRQQVRLKQAMAFNGLPTAGKLPAATAKRSGEATSSANQYASTLTDLFSSIDAPRTQRLNETIERGDLGIALRGIDREAAVNNYLADLKIRSVRRSPFLDFLAAGLGGVGQAAGAGAFNKAAPAPRGTGAVVPGTNVSPQVFYNPDLLPAIVALSDRRKSGVGIPLS